MMDGWREEKQHHPFHLKDKKRFIMSHDYHMIRDHTHLHCPPSPCGCTRRPALWRDRTTAPWHGTGSRGWRRGRGGRGGCGLTPTCGAASSPESGTGWMSLKCSSAVPATGREKR